MNSAGIGGPVDTKGQHEEVLSLGISVLGIRESPDDAGDPQGKAHYLPITEQGLTSYQAESKVRVCDSR